MQKECQLEIWTIEPDCFTLQILLVSFVFQYVFVSLPRSFVTIYFFQNPINTSILHAGPITNGKVVYEIIDTYMKENHYLAIYIKHHW